MRLIGTLDSEKQAFIFYSHLLSQGIHSTYETTAPDAKKDRVSIWIYEEDQVERAIALLEEFKANPNDPKYSKIEYPFVPPQPPDLIAVVKEGEAQKLKEKQKAASWSSAVDSPPKARKLRFFPLTHLTILICALLYFINTIQQVQIYQEKGKLSLELSGMTPLMQRLMFDYPLANQTINAVLQQNSLKSYEKIEQVPVEIKAKIVEAQKIPVWRGVIGYFDKKNGKQGPLFEKIRQGEYWRLFTPCLLHGGLLHILFNMAWVWILMRPMEERLSKWKVLLFVLIVGIIANIAQYFVSGPYFLGFSGIVCGQVGFIWMRQKMAPWEGYPLQKGTFLFILIFVISMFALDLMAFVLRHFEVVHLTVTIANTAHVVGGLLGILLARIPFFSRGMA